MLYFHDDGDRLMLFVYMQILLRGTSSLSRKCIRVSEFVSSLHVPYALLRMMVVVVVGDDDVDVGSIYRTITSEPFKSHQRFCQSSLIALVL